MQLALCGGGCGGGCGDGVYIYAQVCVCACVRVCVSVCNTVWQWCICDHKSGLEGASAYANPWVSKWERTYVFVHTSMCALLTFVEQPSLHHKHCV